MLILLVLQGKFTPEGKIESSDTATSRRIVSVDIDNEDELGDIQHFFCADTEEEAWGLGTEEIGWWRIVEAYEIQESTMELHGDKYPVSHLMSMDRFEEVIKSANERSSDVV